MALNNHSEVSSSLMGRPQGYDDTPLRKRVTCLTSTVLVCFLLAAAALGVSVIVLLKYNADAKIHPEIMASQTKEIAGLKSQIKMLETRIDGAFTITDKKLDEKLSSNEDSTKFKPSDDNIIEEIQVRKRPINKFNLNPDIPQIEERPHDHSKMGHTNMDHSKMDHSNMDHSKMDHSNMDHSNVDLSNMDHSKMDHSNMDHSSMDHSKMDHSNMDHSNMDHSKMGEDILRDFEPETVNEFPCGDDSDLCPGSGSGELEMDDIFNPFDDTEGSGTLVEDGSGFGFLSDDCPPFAMPSCPIGFYRCMKRESNCLVPICCTLKNEHSDHMF